MILFTNCKNCKHEIRIRSFASTRSDLEREKDEVLTLNCPNCGTNQQSHVNDVRARPNKVILIASAVLGVLIAAILWFMLGAVGTITIGIPLLVVAQQRNAVHTFNSYLVKRTKEAKF